MRDSNSDYFREAELATWLDVGRRTLQRWRHTGEGPPFVRFGPRMVLYPKVPFDAWAAARTFAHRAAELASRPGAA